MNFEITQATEILERTPQVLNALLNGLSIDWIKGNEGDDTWNPFDVVGHLIHGEKTDWIARMEIILSDGSEKTFVAFDRFAQFEQSKGKTISQLLDEFQSARTKNLEIIRSKNLTSDDLKKTGIHPVFGQVTLGELLSTWTAHDLGHLAQIARVMAKQYKTHVGPWRAYLPIMDR